jgi:hypothetical protein
MDVKLGTVRLASGMIHVVLGTRAIWGRGFDDGGRVHDALLWTGLAQLWVLITEPGPAVCEADLETWVPGHYATTGVQGDAEAKAFFKRLGVVKVTSRVKAGILVFVEALYLALIHLIAVRGVGDAIDTSKFLVILVRTCSVEAFHLIPIDEGRDRSSVWF